MPEILNLPPSERDTEKKKSPSVGVDGRSERSPSGVVRLVIVIAHQQRAVVPGLRQRLRRLGDGFGVSRVVQDHDVRLGAQRLLDLRAAVILPVAVVGLESGDGVGVIVKGFVDGAAGVRPDLSLVLGHGLLDDGAQVLHVCQVGDFVGGFVDEDAVKVDVLGLVCGPFGVGGDFRLDGGERDFGPVGAEVAVGVDVGVGVEFRDAGHVLRVQRVGTRTAVGVDDDVEGCVGVRLDDVVGRVPNSGGWPGVERQCDCETGGKVDHCERARDLVCKECEMHKARKRNVNSW